MEYWVLKTEFILILISVLPAVSTKRFHSFEPIIQSFQYSIAIMLTFFVKLVNVEYYVIKLLIFILSPFSRPLTQIDKLSFCSRRFPIMTYLNGLENLPYFQTALVETCLRLITRLIIKQQYQNPWQCVSIGCRFRCS